MRHGLRVPRGSAGLLHFACAVGAAQANVSSWWLCLTCKQDFTGALLLRLARERCRLLADRPEEDWERLVAANDLVQTLTVSDELVEALQLGVKTLSTARRVFGNEHVVTLGAMGRLATVHIHRYQRSCGRCGRAAAEDGGAGRAPPRVGQRSRGDVDSDERPLGYAPGHARLCHCAAADPGGFGRQAPHAGSDHIGTIISTGNLGSVHSTMGNHDLVLPLRKECLETSRRVFGSQHPTTLRAAGNCGMLLFNMGDDAAAAPLLREAVQGLTAVYMYGAEHQLVQPFQETLNLLDFRLVLHLACCSAAALAACLSALLVTRYRKN